MKTDEPLPPLPEEPQVELVATPSDGAARNLLLAVMTAGVLAGVFVMIRGYTQIHARLDEAIELLQEREEPKPATRPARETWLPEGSSDSPRGVVR